MANMKNKENPNPQNAGRQKHLEAPSTDNDHQKTVQGKNQRGPADKTGRDAGGSHGSQGQNLRGGSSRGEGGPSVGSHKPGGDGPGTKKFKHEHDNDKRQQR
jgi:hypothetical protein